MPSSFVRVLTASYWKTDEFTLKIDRDAEKSFNEVRKSESLLNLSKKTFSLHAETTCVSQPKIVDDPRCRIPSRRRRWTDDVTGERQK
jgi:hypothetical protein